VLDRPLLEPLPLAYMVSPSVPFLELAASEDTAASPTVVGFFATHADGSTSRARLVFRFGLWVRMSLAHGDDEVVREADYDWSHVPQLSAGADYQVSRRRRYELWRSTGLCPDPHAYEVIGSSWLAAHDHPVGPDRDRLHHYLVLGHDAYVEVLATGWWADEVGERKPPPDLSP